MSERQASLLEEEVRQSVAAEIARARRTARLLQWHAGQHPATVPQGGVLFDAQRVYLERQAPALERIADALAEVLVCFTLEQHSTFEPQPPTARAMAALQEAIAAYQGVPTVEFVAMVALYDRPMRRYRAFLDQEQARVERLPAQLEGRSADLTLPARLQRWWRERQAGKRPAR